EGLCGSRRCLLFERDCAAGVAHAHLVQPGRLSYQWFPLELLRIVRRERRSEPRHDAGLFCDLPGNSGMDFQDRLSAEELITGAETLDLPENILNCLKGVERLELFARLLFHPAAFILHPFLSVRR